MGTLTITLPDALDAYVEKQVSDRSYGTSSAYVGDLIRADRDRQSLRAALLEGAGSETTDPVDDRYFDSLRDRVRQHSRG